VLIRRLLTVTAGTTALLLAPLAGGAAAHVTVSAPGATQGGFTKLVFRAPTEKDVPTTSLEVALPADTPIASVRVKPKTGWTYEMTKGAPEEPFEAFGQPVTEVVTRIVWTSAGPGIAPDEFDEFEVSAGPLPETDQLVFKALQTYADGEVVRWIEEAEEGAEEPEHPAPVLSLAPAEQEGAGSSPVVDTDTEQVATTESTDGAATTLAGVALGLAALALGGAGLAVVRSRRS
jgi:uncharacterized protein